MKRNKVIPSKEERIRELEKKINTTMDILILYQQFIEWGTFEIKHAQQKIEEIRKEK